MPGESDRAFYAFECYLDQPYWNRRDLHAYRHYIGNPNAPNVSATWLAWKSEFLWEERAKAYDEFLRRERREKTIKAQLEAAYERGDELARMEYQILDLSDLLYEKLREKLEEDDLEWRPTDLINVVRLMTETYTAVTKARASEGHDPSGDTQPLSDEELEVLFGED
jgi:hypothetical protein